MKHTYLRAGVWINFSVAVDCYIITSCYFGGFVGKLVASSCSLIAHLDYICL